MLPESAEGEGSRVPRFKVISGEIAGVPITLFGEK